MVSAAICLTALIGCLSVSAATRGKGTFTVGKISGKAGASVTVPIELKYTSGGEGMGIAASLFDVSFDTDALTITDIAAGEDATYDPDVEDKPGGGNVPPQDIYTVEYRSNGETISVVDGAVRILAMPAYNETVPADSETVLTSMTVNLTFTIKEGAAAQDYAITITKQQTCDYGQATPDELGKFTYADDEEFIKMSITDGKVTVEDATGSVLDENISATLGAGLADTVFMSFKISKASLSQYSDFYLVVNRKTKDADWNFVDADPFYINKSDLGGNYLLETETDYWFYYRGTELFSLSVPINAVLYCKDAEGNVVAHSNTFSSTLSDLLKDLYTNAKSKNNAKLATAIIDTLVAGDEAQKFFTKSKPDSDYGKLESPIAGFSTEIEIDATDKLGELNAIDIPYDVDSDADLTLGAGVAESPFISAYLSNLPAESNIDSYSVEFSYYDSIAKKTITSTTNGADMLENTDSTRFYSYFRSLAIYASNADVTVKVFKDDLQLGTAHYSFEQFVSLKKDDPRLGKVITALGKLGQSFRVLKGI